MTFKHKISRRLALLRDALILAVVVAACSDAVSPTGPGGADALPAGTIGLVLSGSTAVGARIEATHLAFIRTGPSVNTSLAGKQPKGSRGTIIAGPVVDINGDGLTRYQIDFDSGVDGWGAAAYFNQIANAPVATVTISPSPAMVELGETLTLVATPRDASGHILSGRTVSFVSTDTTIAKVTASGVISGVATGTALVQATVEGKTARDTVIVSRTKIGIGARVAPTSTAYLRSAPTVTATLVGTQPAGALATVVEGPVTDTNGDGLTRWRLDFDAGVDGWGAEPYLSLVTPTPSSSAETAVDVTPATASVVAGGTVQLSASATDGAGTSLGATTFTWVSRDTTRVRVNSTGLVTAIAVGTSWVVATSGTASDSSAVSVTAVPVASVTITPATPSIEVGKTTQLSAALRDASGATLTGRSVSWSSSAPTVASVSSTGLVTGLIAGTATITATSEAKAGSATVTITAPAPAVRVGKYVSPSGTTSNDGSVSNPWTLAYALSGAGGRIVAGDTVWVRGGTYSGAFTSSIAGTSGKPVVVRAYPGERVTLAHAGTSLTTLHVRGAWSVFWGLEVTNPDPTRVTSSTASEQRANGVVNNASNTKYINMIIHDTGVGFYNYTNLVNVEVHGSIFYNNGWQGPDRGHGHALYIKSDNGPVLLKDNVLFNQFGYGVHVYTNLGSGKLNNIRIEGNTAFNNGTLSTNSNSENILLGGADYSTGSAVVDNLTYFSPGKGGRNVRVGYSTLMNGSVSVTGNRFVGGNPVLEVGYWNSATVSANRLVGGAQMVRLNNGSTSGLSWLTNTQFRDPTSTAWYSSGSWRTFSGWKSASGLGVTDVASSATPVGPEITIRPSQYEAGRATITVFDWSRSGSVMVALTGVLAIGDRYEVRNVQSLWGAPLASGTFGGSLILPMGAVSAPAPVGMSSSVAPRLGTDFDVFVVTKLP